MNQNKNFAAQLMASVGCFVALPISFYWAYVAIESFKGGVEFMSIVWLLLFVLAVAVIAMETVAMVMTRKGKEMNKVYNIVTMVLNALFAVLSLVVLVLLLIDFGAFDFEVFIMLCLYFLPILFAGAANGTAFGFKLFNMLKK